MISASAWLQVQRYTHVIEVQIENLFFKGPLAELMRTDRLTVGLTKNIGDQKLWGWNGVKMGTKMGSSWPLYRDYSDLMRYQWATACTMFQKLSKCEVKNLFATQFCVKSILAKFRSQKLPFLQFQRLSTLNFGTFGTWEMAQIY